MNTRMIGFVLGRILLTETGLLTLPLVVAALYGETLWPWIASIILTAACGGVLSSRKPERTALYAKDGFVTVALAWLAMSAFGALPFVLNGDIPHYVDAFFETVSGFTTTGASILTAVEPLSRGGLFWRSFTHWVGGMGVLVFVMAILPMSDGHSMHILRAEMPGPTAGKLVSRMSDTAKILYSIYLAMTVVMIALLLLGGMDLFDACVHAFGTAGTFSSRNLSIGAYNSAYIDIVTGVGMLAFGVNFNLYYFLLVRRFRDVLKSEELWAYLGIVAFSTLTIAANILRIYGSVGTSLRVLHHHHHRIRHGGLRPVAGVRQNRAGAADVHRRLRRFHRRRPEGHAGGDAGQGGLWGYAKDAPPQRGDPGADGRAGFVRKAGAGRAGLFFRVYAAVCRVLAAAESGRLRPDFHLYRTGLLLQQYRPRSGTGWPHRQFLRLQPVGQAAAEL